MKLSTVFTVLALLVLAAGVAWGVKRLKFLRDRRKVVAVVAPVGQPFPCIIEGSYSTPDRDVAIAARNMSLIHHNHAIAEGNNPDDNTTFENTALKGGVPWGGIWLAGSVYLDIDERGQAKPNSWVTVFDEVKHPVTGGIEVSGKIGMASVAGVSMGGSVANGLDLIVSESGRTASTDLNSDERKALAATGFSNLQGNVYGDKVEFVHGRVNGTYRKT